MVDLRDAFGAFRIRSIDDVQQQVRVARFLEGRTEGGHELVRQVPDETDRVGERDVGPAATPRRRTVGSSVAELVGGKRLRRGQPIEQR